MSQYILRLDDASPRRNISNWIRMEKILNIYNIKPLVGVIPQNQDPSFSIYPFDSDFWSVVHGWINNGWTIAMHGYNHVFSTDDGGINPINYRSEFAGLSLPEQEAKIEEGIRIMHEHNIFPKVFFAPAHTFDENTLLALKNKSDIIIISDTIANSTYYKAGFYFVPQQSGRVRKLPLKTVTFCYHPNNMTENDFIELEKFIEKNKRLFISFCELELKRRKKNMFDRLLEYIYFKIKKQHHGNIH